jgi:hypothetical protein
MSTQIQIKFSKSHILQSHQFQGCYTNPVEHTKQHLPSILIKNQVQDNGQMRLVILNRNPSKLVQSNAIVINKIIGTKDQGHTCL